jgi:aspartate/methionine/tyrosine aminotransferase
MKLHPFKLERYLARYEFSAPYLLCTSDCESMALHDLLALEPEAARHFNELWLGYTESLGHPDLRQAIAGLYTQVASEQVLVHAGAEEAIFNFMNVALDPGDHVVVQAPYYQSLGEVAQAIGARVDLWQGDDQRGWMFDLEDLKKKLTARTKVVVVNFPHNPTGFLPSLEFARELSLLSEQYGFVIFADEVYRGLELEPARRLPGFVDLNSRAVSLGVMSKTYGLAGLRIGWIATRDRGMYAAMAGFKDYTSICNSAPSEFLAALALRHAQVLVDRNLAIIRSNLDCLDAFFASHESLFDWSRPRAGSVAFPRLKQGDVEKFCAELVEQAGVLLLPGTLYAKGMNHFRVGFGRVNVPEAVQVLAQCLTRRHMARHMAGHLTGHRAGHGAGHGA